MEEEIYLNEEKLIEDKKLMKKSLRAIISFFTLTIACIVLFIILQDNKFFIFNIHRSYDNVPNPMISQLFSLFFIVIIIIGFISFIILGVRYFRRLKEADEERIASFDNYKKLYNTSDIFSVVPVFLVIVMVVNGFFFSFAQVDGPSMQPTFCDNDAVIIKYVEDYNQEDIVIFEVQEDGSTIYLIKRLIAGPGDKLVVNQNGVYVNDVLVEDTIVNGLVTYDIDEIPDGFYYVMGDNRNNSSDSRTRGLIAYDDLIGIVVLKI
jgi:signal peptidase I